MVHRVFLEKLTVPHCMGPENSLPCSQEPATGPHPEPAESSPVHTVTHYSYHYPNIEIWVLQIVFFLQVFRLRFFVFFISLTPAA